MLHAFRESIGRVVAIAILALIAVTFVFFGVGNNSTSLQTSYAAKVNGEKISLNRFEDELLATQTQFQQQNQVELTDDLRQYLRREVIDRMVLREALLQKARDTGYRVSDARLVAEIRSMEPFQIQGQFSADVYKSRLAAEGLSQTAFEAQQREVETLREVQDAIMDAAFITPAEFRRSIELIYERRQVAWAEFAAADFADQVEISDEDVAAYRADNESSYMSDEAVDLEFVEVSLASVADTIEIGEDDLLDEYAAEGETYAGSEERRVRHIQISIGDDPDAARAEAEDVLARLQAGEDFATLAAEASDDAGTSGEGGDLGWVARGILPDPLDDTVFSMDVGGVAGPVETSFGYHVLELDDVRITEQPPFELERDRIRNKLAEEQAYSAYLDRVDELDDAAYDAIDDLASVADDLGLELQHVEGLTRSNAGDYLMNAAAVVSTAFDDDAIVSGENSDLIQLGEDVVGVIRVAAYYPPVPEPLEAVADDIRELLTLEAAGALAGAAADAFSDALDPAGVAAGTQDPAELAAMHGGHWNEAVWVDRASASDVPSGIVSRVLSETRPAEGTIPKLRVRIGSYDEAVVLLLAVEPGVPGDIPTEERDQGQEQLTQQTGQAEFNAYANDVELRAKVQIPESILNPDP